MKIKTTLFLILLTLLYINSFGQSKVKINKVNNLRLVTVLNNVDLLKETKTSELAIRIYSIGNEPGSAGYANDEITNNLLIAVSEFDEYPDQNLFEIGPFYNPTFKKWTTAENGKNFVIEYGPFDHRKSIILSVDINQLKIIKITPAANTGS